MASDVPFWSGVSSLGRWELVGGMMEVKSLCTECQTAEFLNILRIPAFKADAPKRANRLSPTSQQRPRPRHGTCGVDSFEVRGCSPLTSKNASSSFQHDSGGCSCGGKRCPHFRTTNFSVTRVFDYLQAVGLHLRAAKFTYPVRLRGLHVVYSDIIRDAGSKTGVQASVGTVTIKRISMTRKSSLYTLFT